MNLDESQGNNLLTHYEIMHKMINFYKNLLLELEVEHTSAIERVIQKISTIITQE